MISKPIENRQEFLNDPTRSIVVEILEEGLRSANPYSSVISELSRLSGRLGNRGKIIVVGFGKASHSMALACEKFLGERIASGTIIVPKGSVESSELARITILEGTHPIPTDINVNAVKQLLSCTANLNEKDLVICLISGGGSALSTYPAKGITLSDKQEMTKLLLAAGSTIQEINCIRKHISAVKGGQLARHFYPAQVIGLILSDVVGDEISSIASGPTSADQSTFEDVWALFEKYDLIEKAPKNILERVRKGLNGEVPDTPKQGDRVFEKVTNILVANSMKALKAMALKAESLGLKSTVLTSYLEGEAREVGKVIASIAKQVVFHRVPIEPPCAIFFGGETTVTVRGKGKGGRNQELALSLATAIKGLPKVTFSSIGSDGIDGYSDAAGAIVDGATIGKALKKGLSPTYYLQNNDSNSFFRQVGDLIYTGQTGTNVNDLAFLLILD